MGLPRQLSKRMPRGEARGLADFAGADICDEALHVAAERFCATGDVEGRRHIGRRTRQGQLFAATQL